MAGSELAGHIRRFPRVLGALVVSPGPALREIEVAQKGGFSGLVIWCVLAAVTLRFVSLADAIVGFDAGGGMRVVSVLVAELTGAVPIALGGALAIVILAGSRRDPGLDLELGCAVAIPFLLVRAVFRAIVILLGRELPPLWGWGAYALGGVWSVGLLVLALRIALRRPSPRGPAATARQVALAPLAGWAAIAVLGAGLAGGVTYAATHAARLGPVARGSEAPDFTLPRIDGKPGTLALSSFRGRVVVLDFWATWCPPCLAMMPTMDELSRELEPAGVSFLGVDSDGAETTPEGVSAFLATHPVPYPVVYDDGTANSLYRIKALPTVVIVGRDGNVKRVLMGISTKSTLSAAVKAAAEP